MTKKDFILIAEILRKAHSNFEGKPDTASDYNQGALTAINQVRNMLEEKLRETNPRFDAERFRAHILGINN